jgi:hypothetical protein
MQENIQNDYKEYIVDLLDRIEIDINQFFINVTYKPYMSKDIVLYKCETCKAYRMTHSEVFALASGWIDATPISKKRDTINMLAKAYIATSIIDYTNVTPELSDFDIINSVKVKMNDYRLIELSCTFIPNDHPKFCIDPLQAVTTSYLDINKSIAAYLDEEFGVIVSKNLKEKITVAMCAKIQKYIAVLHGKIDDLFINVQSEEKHNKI